MVGNRLSTSSSSAGSPPLAALMALFVGLLIDATAFNVPAFWRNVSVPENLYNLLELGVVRDRRELLDADEWVHSKPGESERPVFVVGSSRVEHGFKVDAVPKLGLSRERLVKLAHPQFFPFEMRAAAERIASYQPAVVVLALSELETHSPIDLQPGASFGDVRAVIDLVRAMGPGFAFEHRKPLTRIALMSWFDTYHYRGVLEKAGLGNFRSFRSARRPLEAFLSSVGSNEEVEDSGDEASIADIVAELDRDFPGPGSIADRLQFATIRSIALGEHAQANLALTRRTVEILIRAGSRVVLVEPPIYPRARALYDAGAREEFVRFARTLSEHESVTFVSLDQNSEYALQDFNDLTHLNRQGANTFTLALLEVIADELASIAQNNSTSPK